jgi:hypothetical protein
MADAEDLKSSGDFSSCGFDSHPGHHFVRISGSAAVLELIRFNRLAFLGKFEGRLDPRKRREVRLPVDASARYGEPGEIPVEDRT